MTSEEEIEKKWRLVLNNFINEHSKQMKGMTEEESNKYIKENKINEKLELLQKEFQKKHNIQK